MRRFFFTTGQFSDRLGNNHILNFMAEFYFAHQIGFAIIGVVGMIASIGVGIALALTFARLRRTEKKLIQFFAGKNARDLEAVLLDHSSQLKSFDKEIQELFDISNRIHTLSSQSLHKVGIVRFNPFKDVGGDQSFALALLDASDSGVVISSLHSRDGARIYVKPVVKKEGSGHELTAEEEQAIKLAHPHKTFKKI